MASTSSHELLADLALLSAASVLVHYFFGLAGVAAVIAAVALLEHGADVAAVLLDRSARCVALRGTFAAKAAVAVAAIRARRTTKTASRTSSSGGFFAALRAVVADNDQLHSGLQYLDSSASTDDPRALLERFASDDAAPDAAAAIYDSDAQREPSDAVSDASALSSVDDDAAQLVIRDLSSGTNTTDRFIPLNARAPVAFETDLFAGHVLFLVRTTPEDAHWSHVFHGRQRLVWIQVQGAFKRAPRGTVYLGGELAAPIAPGVVARSVARVIMGLVQRLVGSVHYSFGDARRDVVPSIALPLFQCADQLVVTPAGEQAPPMGTRDFGETEAARQQRRATPVGTETFVVGPTYSFDFHTMHVDLARWRTANLPGLRAMDLGTFFGALPLRMVAYDIAAAPTERHCQPLKTYLFQFEVEYQPTTGSAAGQLPEASRLLEHAESDAAADDDRSDETTAMSIARSGTNGIASTSSSAGGMSTVASDASLFDDMAVDDALSSQRMRAERLGALAITYVAWLEEVDVATGVRRVHLVFSVRDDSDDGALVRPQRLAVVSAYALRSLLLAQLKHRRKRRDRTAATLSLGRSRSSISVVDDADSDDDALAPLAALRFHCQSRIGSYSVISDEARVVAACLDGVISHARADVDAVDSSDVDTDSTTNDDSDTAFHARLYECLTQRTQLASAACSPSRLGVNWSQRERTDLRAVCDGVVLRYYAHALLRQEVLLATTDELLFFRSYASNAEKRVACRSVLDVRALPSLPLAGCDLDDADVLGLDAVAVGAFALQISTLTEEIVLCVGSAHARSAWLRVLSELCPPTAAPAELPVPTTTAAELLSLCSSVGKPLKPVGRIVLNARSLFPPRLSTVDTDGDGDAVAAYASLAAVTRALDLALCVHDRRRDCDAIDSDSSAMRVAVAETRAFLDAASALRVLDLRAAQRVLPHEALLALYLNLYHVVLAHATLAHSGFPRGRSQFAFIATRMCYSVGVDGGRSAEQLELSLAEIELLLLRRRMAPPDVPYLSVSSLLSDRIGATPVQQQRQRQLAGLGVAHPDFRLIFALAMHQQPASDGDGVADVVVYAPDTVHEQLNAVAQRALSGSNAVAVEPPSRTDSRALLWLPRVCEWYRLDFGGSGSPLYCARKLLGFLDGRVQEHVLAALDDPLATRVTYRAFAFDRMAALQRIDVVARRHLVDDVDDSDRDDSLDSNGIDQVDSDRDAYSVGDDTLDSDDALDSVNDGVALDSVERTGEAATA